MAKPSRGGKKTVNKTVKRGKKGVNKTRKYKKGSRKNVNMRGGNDDSDSDSDSDSNPNIIRSGTGWKVRLQLPSGEIMDLGKWKTKPMAEAIYNSEMRKLDTQENVSDKNKVISGNQVTAIMTFADFKSKFKGKTASIRNALKTYKYNPDYNSCNNKVLRNADDQAFDLVTCWGMHSESVDELIDALRNGTNGF